MSKKLFALPPGTHGKGTIHYKWQRRQGNYVATTGADCILKIWDRHGDSIYDVRLNAPVVDFGWNYEGDYLAIASEDSAKIHLWNATSFKSTIIDTGIKKIPILGKHEKRIVCGVWSRQGLLALGSTDNTISISNAEGDSLYDASTQSEPSSLQFNENGNTGEDNIISCILGHAHLLLYNFKEDKEPVELAFSKEYGKIRSHQWFGAGFIMIGFSRGFVVSISTNKNEIGEELSKVQIFKSSLTSLSVCERVNMYAGCGESSSIKLYDSEPMKSRVNENPDALSAAGDVVSLINLEEETEGLEFLAWADDGSLLAVSSKKGALHIFLVRLPALHSVCINRIAYLTSLKEVTIEEKPPFEIDPTGFGLGLSAIEGPGSNIAVPLVVPVDLEPQFVAVGPDHLAIGMNALAYFYLVTPEQGAERLSQQQYLGAIQHMKLNSVYAAALLEGKVQLSIIDKGALSQRGAAEEETEERESVIFPDKSQRGENNRVTCFDLTSDFLIYGSTRGFLMFFCIEDWNHMNEYRHTEGIRRLYANPTGTKVAFVDDKGQAFIYCPLTDQLLHIPGLQSSAKGGAALPPSFLWESHPTNQQIFVACESDFMNTYALHTENLGESCVTLVGRTRCPVGVTPVALRDGEISLHASSGKLHVVTLGTHVKPDDFKSSDQAKLEKSIRKAVALLRWRDTWRLCDRLDEVSSTKTAQGTKKLSANARKAWVDFGEAALRETQVQLAIMIYRRLGDAGMVWSLEDLLNDPASDDINFLQGHIAAFLNKFEMAQNLFMRSSQPQAALDLCIDLQLWEQALQLAIALDKSRLPSISKQFASQLEFVGDFVNALHHYEKGVTRDPEQSDHDEVCAAGIARCAIRTGDVRRGLSLALALPNKQIKRDCAQALESLKQFGDAGELYSAAEMVDQAAACFIRAKNWSQVSLLLNQVTSTKIFTQFAKAKEAEGKHEEAVVAYGRANDVVSQVRIYLDHLHDPQKAVAVAQKSDNVDAARLVARFFQQAGDYGSAVQFLVLSDCIDEAFELARQHRLMDVYAAAIGETRTPNEYKSVAVYYEQTERDPMKAGKFYIRAGMYEKAVKILLKHHQESVQPSSSNTDGYAPGQINPTDPLSMAIQAAGKAQQAALTKVLIDYVMGETDGVVKDAKYMFQLYLCIGQYREAAKTAVIVAREEQKAGNYRNAHDLLFGMFSELRTQGIQPPSEMTQSLMVLHSYILVRYHVKLGDHLLAARLLIRVADYISRFPCHVVPILTSAVIECQRSGLKKDAFGFAATLLRPEYRDQIDEKYKKKIENIVRKPDTTPVDPSLEDPTSACPFCGSDLASTLLTCITCQRPVPYCAASGLHVTLQDLVVCSSCKFPAIFQYVTKMIQNGVNNCTMCNAAWDPETIKRLSTTEARSVIDQIASVETPDGPTGAGDTLTKTK